MKTSTKNLLVAAASLILSAPIFSQTLITKWGSSVGMPCGFNYTCYDIQTAPNGNHIVTGNISSSAGIYADLNPSPTAAFPSSSNTYNNDFYVSQYDPSGNFISAFIIGSAGVSVDAARSIAVDNGNNIILTGYFNATVDFDPSATGTVNVTSNGGNDIFLAKYSNSGSLLWIKTFGGSGSDVGMKVVTDNQNRIFMTASFNGTIDIDPSSSITNLVSLGGSDVCLARFDANGNLIAGVSFGNTGAETAVDIVLDSGKRCYITGNFAGTVDFDPHPTNTFTIANSGGATDIYICQFDSTLSFQWAKSLVCSSSSDSKDINIDNTGNILLCGTYVFAAIDLDPSPTSTVNFAPTSGGRSGFIAKYTNTGTYLWAGTFGNNNSFDNEAISVWSDNTGSVFSSGHFIGTVDFDLATATSYTVGNNSTTLPSLYYAQYTSTGNFVSAKKMTNPGVKSLSCHADASGDLLFCGNLFGAVNIDPSGSNPYTLAFPNQCGNYYIGFFSKYITCVLPVVTTLTSSANGLCAGTTLTLSLTGSLNSSTDWRWSQNSCASSNTLGLGTSVVVTPTASTVYYVKGIGGCGGTNLGCTSISISALPSPTMTLTSSNSSICANTTVTLSAGGASSYTWNTGSNSSSVTANIAASTVYSVSTTGTNNCIGTKTISVYVHSTQPLTYSLSGIETLSDTVCIGGNVAILFAGGSQYTWTCNCTGFASAPSNLYLSFINLQSSDYATVFSKDVNGCENGLSYNLTVLSCTGIQDYTGVLKQLIKVYPNPLKSILFVDNKELMIRKLIIRDVSGKLLIERDIAANTVILEQSTELLEKGIYLLEIYSQQGLIQTDKLIKE